MSLLTGAEYRHKAKQRLQRFREQQEKKGYKSITIFASENLRVELSQLETEQGLTRQEALEHIFNIYKQTMNIKNVACNTTKTKPQIADIPANTGASYIKKNDTIKITPPHQYPNKQQDIPFIEPLQLPDCHNKALDVSTRDKFLLQVAEMFPGKGQNQKKADALNAAGILTGTGLQWTSKNVYDTLRLIKKKLKI